MRLYPWLLAVLLTAAWTPAVRSAPLEGKDAIEDKGAVATSPKQSNLRFMRPYRGNLILVVDYPWQAHAGPSVEVQWLADDQPEPLSSRPLGFADDMIKGEISWDVQRCRDEGEKLPCAFSRTRGDIDFEIQAKRNSLGKSAVWVDFHLKTPDAKTETRTAFCLLESWAIDGRTLMLDLPPRYYAQPGRLRVWMLRGKDTVWMETIRWPGMPGATDEMQSAVVQADKTAAVKKGSGKKAGTGAKAAEAGEKTPQPAPGGKAAAKKPAKSPKGDGKKAGDGDNIFDAKE